MEPGALHKHTTDHSQPPVTTQEAGLLKSVTFHVQGFNIAAMYDDLSTLEIKLNKLLASKGERPLEKVPGSPRAAGAAAAEAH